MNEGKTLLVCVQGRDKLKQWMENLHYRDCACADGAVEARRMVSGDAYALVIINAPLPDETGFELATQLTERTSAGIILLVKNALVPMIGDPMSDSGVLIVPKPVVPQLFEQAVRLSMACRNRMLRYKAETERLQAKFEELKIVDRAKCLLIEHMRITEEEAHRALEKQAMDERLPRVRVAREIVQRYEL